MLCFCMSQELYILQSDVTLISFSDLFLSVLHKRIISFLPLERHPKRNKMRTSDINKKLSWITWMKNGPQNMPTRLPYLSFHIVKLCLLTNKTKALHPQVTRIGPQSTHFKFQNLHSISVIEEFFCSVLFCPWLYFSFADYLCLILKSIFLLEVK